MSTPEEDDLQAAEYALGTLDASERQAANRRRSAEPAFDQAVEAWEQRLAPLTETVDGPEPPAHVWAAILAQIRSASARVAGSNVIDLSRQLGRWKRATAASLALAAALALWIALGPTLFPHPPEATFVAVLQRTTDQPAFVVKADLRDRAMSVSPVAAEPVPGKSYELWIVDPSVGGPKSLGVLGSTSASRTVLPDVPREVLSRATYAVTVEQPGGSPTGKPTNAPIFFGHLLRADP